MPKVQPRSKTDTTRLETFDGGVNLRDAPTEVELSETPDCMNMTLDERGGAISRLGLSKLNGASLLPATADFLYYSTVADAVLAYVSTDAGNGKLFKSTNGGVTWSLVLGTFVAGAQAAIADFTGVNGPRVVVVTTLDGVYSFAADLASNVHTAGGSANMTEVRGSAIAVWQNKCWVTGDIREDTTHSRARVWFCVAGNEQQWTVASHFVDLRDVDAYQCTAIGAGQGMDVTGKPTLVVYKERSTYRINDSTTGSFTTLHNKGSGAASQKAVASNLGRICSINQQGIWVTDGLAVPIRVSDKLEPLFSAEGLNLGVLKSWSAAPYRDRIVFSLPRASSLTNNLVLEYHPAVGWTVPHKMNLGPMAIFTKETAKLFSVSSTGGQLYETFKGGTDDGVAISARYQTPWVGVGGGDEARLRAMRVFGRGDPTVEVRTDFRSTGDAYPLVFDTGTGGLWGTGQWGTFAWGDPGYEGVADVPLDQVCKYVSLFFSDITSSNTFRTPLLGDGNALESGAWAVYGANLDHIFLGT